MLHDILLYLALGAAFCGFAGWRGDLRIETTRRPRRLWLAACWAGAVLLWPVIFAAAYVLYLRDRARECRGR